MHEETEKIEDIDRITMYKMIRALHRYDYFSTKCFVNELLKRRKDIQEIKNLNILRDLLFYQEDEKFEKKLEELIEKKAKRKWNLSTTWICCVFKVGRFYLLY